MLHAQEKVAEHLGLARIVTAVIAPKNVPTLSRYHHAFDSSGPYIQAHHERYAGGRVCTGFIRLRAHRLNVPLASEPV